MEVQVAKQRPAGLLGSRLAPTRAEAADSLGVSVDFFRDHIQPGLRLVRKGRLVLVPLKELEKWVETNAAMTLE